MNERKIGIFLSYLNIIIQAIVGFVYVPILVYYIGQAEYGLYQLMGSLVAYFGVMDFGLSSSTIRTYIKHKTNKEYDKIENFLAMTQRLYAIICTFIVIVSIIIYYFFDEIFRTGLNDKELISGKYILILLIFNIIITLMGMIYRSVITANEKFFFIKSVETIQLILQPIAVVCMMQVEPTALAVVFVMTILNVILTVIRVYYCYNKLGMRIKYHFWDWKDFKEIKKLALSVFIVTVVDQIFWKTNQIILGIISGTIAVSVYAVASLVYMNYLALSTAISSVYLPKITKLVMQNVSNKILSDEFLRIGRLQYFLLSLVLSGFFLFGQEFISVWLGDNFLDAYYISLIIIVPFTINLIQNMGSCMMLAKNVYNIRAYVYLGVGVLNLILAIPLAENYGGIGCAVASGVALFLSNGLIMNWYFKKYLMIDICLFWKKIAQITFSVFIATIIGIGINYLFPYGSVKYLLLKIILYTCIYCILMWISSFNDYEKSLVIKLKNKIMANL